MVGESLFNQRSTAAAMELKNEARRLSARGLTVAEIARRLSRSEQTVRFYLMPKHGSQRPHSLRVGKLPRREKAEEMASVYDDEKRRRWIFEQMGLEYPE